MNASATGGRRAVEAPRIGASGGPGVRVWGDGLLVAALTVLTVVTLPVLGHVAPGSKVSYPVAYSLVMLIATATFVRRRWPLGAAAVAAAGLGVYLALGAPYGPVFGLLTLTLYTVGRWLPLPRAIAVACFAFLALCPHLLTNEASLPGGWGLVPAAAWVIVPTTLGVARRSVVAAAARQRAAEAQQAVADERLRLAQEVHDIVGHGLAAITMQADIALHVAGRSPEQATRALKEISRASNVALEDLRETLRTIHPDGPGHDANRPTPGLARVPELRDRIAAAGIDVRLEIEGEPQPLPTTADVTAYRVLQEALTNVVKHAAHPSAAIRIAHDPDMVTIEVVNPAPARVVGDPEREGLGIGGMRRRVAAVGGTLDAGVVPSAKEFRVAASIPRRSSGPEEGM